MTKEKVLEEAIYKAYDNGWDLFDLDAYRLRIGRVFKYDKRIYVEPELEPSSCSVPGIIIRRYTVEEILFNHAFAKALWGEENGSPCIKSFCEDCSGWHEDKDRPKSAGYYPEWAYRIQQMVMADDPIKYLGKNLPS